MQQERQENIRNTGGDGTAQSNFEAYQKELPLWYSSD
jgi:hypothetical protein